MAVCKRDRAIKLKLCSGDLNQLISIQNRTIKPPTVGSVDFSVIFEDQAINDDQSSVFQEGQVWAFISTTGGKTVFDGVNERVVTHEIRLRYIEGLTAEAWVLYEGGRYDIVTVEDIDEAHDYMKLKCNFRGMDTQYNTSI